MTQLVQTAERIEVDFTKVDVTNEDEVAISRSGSGKWASRVLVNCDCIAPAIKTVGKYGALRSLDAFGKAVLMDLVGSIVVCLSLRHGSSTAIMITLYDHRR